jgi:predicted site-specific integrase-resolvase
MHLKNKSMEQYVNTKEAMAILGIRSQTTIGKYETDGKIKVYRPFSNRKRYKVSELLKIQRKR